MEPEFKVTIVNKVVRRGQAFKIAGHLNMGQYMVEQLRELSEKGRVAAINGETGKQTTHKQILQDVVNVATGLRKMGLKRGDIVCFCSENRDEYMATAIAVICCGATVATANMQYTNDELMHTMNIARPKIVIASEDALKLQLKTFQSMPYVNKLIQLNGTPVSNNVVLLKNIVVPTDVDEFEVTDVEGWSDAVFILFSSGTTGLPKGVKLTHLNMLYALAGFEGEDDVETCRIQTVVPWYHAYGLMSTMFLIVVGKLIVYFAGFNPVKYLQAIQDYKVNFLYVVPPMVVFLAKSPIVEKYDVSSVMVMWCGAAPLSAETINATMKRFPNCKGIFQAYGMTETSLAATKDIDNETVKPKVGSGGVPIPGVKAKVVDPETREKLGPNQKGEICLKGPIIMHSYIGDTGATSEIIDEEGYLKTGDIGYYDNDGYFYIIDRIKELVKYKGSQVPPAVVENVLLQHEAVAECGVVGTPDEDAGELPTAFVVLKPGAKATAKDIIDFSNARLSKAMRLYGGVHFLNEIPKNQSGKILRRKLRELVQNKKKSKL